MNIALITSPSTHDPILPPLGLAYVAALLEQRRHIVRVYDLAVPSRTERRGDELRPLRMFRPQAVVLVGTQTGDLADDIRSLVGDSVSILSLEMGRDGADAPATCSAVMAWIEQLGGVGKRSMPIFDLDCLPFPARHLLSLETYTLRNATGDLQTSLQIGGRTANGMLSLRDPELIATEIRSISYEYGIRHYTFVGGTITDDPEWLIELCIRMHDICPGARWSAHAAAHQFTPKLLRHLSIGGCEQLELTISAADVCDSAEQQTRMRSLIASAEAEGIRIVTELLVDRPTMQTGRLVALAAVCGMDDLSVRVTTPSHGGAFVENERLTAQIRAHYPQQRYRQRFIDHFGPALGPFVWNLRNMPWVSGMFVQHMGME